METFNKELILAYMEFIGQGRKQKIAYIKTVDNFVVVGFECNPDYMFQDTLRVSLFDLLSFVFARTL